MLSLAGITGKTISSLSRPIPRVKLSGSPLKKEFLNRKLKLVTQTMAEQGVDMWLTFTREGNEDPLVQDLRFSDLTWRSAAIIERDGWN